MADISVDRTSLELPALVFPGERGTSPIWLVTIGRPGKTWERTRAGAAWLHGGPQTSAKLDVSSLPLTVGVQGSSTGDLDALMDEVDEAFCQFVFPLTVVRGTSQRTWKADCTDIQWGDIKAGEEAHFVATATFTVPVHPIPTPGGP